MSKVRFLGLDVHAETIAVAIAEPNGRSSFTGNHSQSFAIGAKDDRQARSDPAIAGLL